MKNLLVVCLVLSLGTLAAAQSPKPELFTVAERAGDPYPTYFFVWSTSAGNYIVRKDGMGEFTSPQGLRRVFYLKVGKSRLERVYFLEHERDLFLLYEVGGQGYFLVRMEQTKRKLRWSTAVGNLSGEDPSLSGDLIVIGTLQIREADGSVVKQE